MKVRFWGTRGSIPVSVTAPDIRAKLIAALSGAVGRGLDTPEKIAEYVDRQLGFEVAGTFGGHSSCVQVTAPDLSHVILDMGSGARPLGQHFLAQHGRAAQTYHVFMSHLHWDHIMGFPFFGPVYMPGNRIVVHGCHEGIEEAFRRQQAEPSFPVDFSQLAADVTFRRLEPGKRYEIAGLAVTPKLQLHAGDSYGYRLEAGGKCVVYSTDSEHRLDNEDQRRGFIEFFGRADLVIFDAMYSLFEAISVKADWGHSSNIVGVELAQAARAKTLALFHHEPTSSDAVIAKVLDDTRRLEQITRTGRRVEISAAYDGLEIAF